MPELDARDESAPIAQEAERGERDAQRSEREAQRGERHAQRSEKPAEHSEEDAQRRELAAQRSEREAERSERADQRNEREAQRSERAAQRSEREDAPALLLSALQLAVYERHAPGNFESVNQHPKWLVQLVGDLEGGLDAPLTEIFPALEGFLPLAEKFWERPSVERLQWDFFTQNDGADAEYHLLAQAMTSSGRHFLAIERAEATFNEHQQLQFLAHDMQMRHETIEKLNREVERATQAKSDFLASMSHEIRTPLNAILGMADLLAETELSAEQRRYVEVFQRAGGNLLGLINDILDLSKVEAGHMELEAVDFELADVLTRVLELTRVRAGKKGLSVNASIAPGLPPMLVGDPLRLRQVLLNLLGNGMKFTDSGRLDVEVSQNLEDRTPGSLLFRVRDTGIGIPADKLDSIFENFSQADSSTTRKYGGTGLGLAISKRLVALMGGRIWVESVVGQGSIFCFTVKLGVSTQVPAAAETRAVIPELASTAARHILLADDSEDNRFLIAEYLKHTPCVLDIAENGRIALDKMQANHYDLVLMDAHMPVMDGYTATRAMRAWEAVRGTPQPRLPILALTADAFKESVERSAAAGFQTHLTKPITKATLIEAIERYALRCTRPASTHTQPADPAPQLDPAVAALAPRYLKNMRKEVGALQAAVGVEDFATIQRIGHNLHGTGGSFGFPRITELGAAMEQAAKDRAIEPIRQALASLAEYLELQPAS